MSRLLIVDACVLIDYAESRIEVLSLASLHVGTVHVAAPVLSEAREHVSRGRCEELGIVIIEPEAAELDEAAAGTGGLSFEDRLSLILARKRGLTCVTSDRALRNACLQDQVDVLWSLQLLLLLVGDGHLAVDVAARIASTIHASNPWHVGQSVLDSFLTNLSEIQCKGSDPPRSRTVPGGESPQP